MFENYKALGNSAYQQNNSLLAIEYYKQAFGQGEDATVNCNVGLCYFKLQDYAKAYGYFNRALKSNADYAKAKFNLAKTCFMQQHYQEALDNFTNFLSGKTVSHCDKITALQYIEKCNRLIKPAISFLIFDLKFDGQKVVILESGTGATSAFVGYNQLYPKESMIDKAKKTLQKINPLCQVHFINKDWPADCSNILKAKEALTKTQHQKNTEDTDSSDLSAYAHILIGGHVALAECLHDNPQVLVVNDGFGTDAIAANKRLTHQIIAAKHRPRCVLVPKNSVNDQHFSSILKEFGKKIIVKHPTMNRGEGVRIADNTIDAMKEKLTQLKQITTIDDDQLEPYRLIEEIAHSKLIDGFDATMRAAFLVTQIKGKFSFIPLGLYWKLPKEKSCGQDTQAELISSYTDKRHESRQVSQQDADIIWPQIEKIMVDALPKILQFDLSILEEVNSKLNSTNTLAKEEGIYLLGALCNYYGAKKQFVLQEHCISLFIRHVPKSEFGYALMAGLYMDQENYQDAIFYFREAIMRNANSAILYNGLALCLRSTKADKQEYLSALEKSWAIKKTEVCCQFLIAYYMENRDDTKVSHYVAEGYTLFPNNREIQLMYQLNSTFEQFSGGLGMRTK